jgi:hypothetical protein
MDDFSRNPCRHHLFEVFALDKSETDLRTVRAAAQAAHDRLRFGKLTARDGSELRMSEAELNRLEQVLMTPVARLAAEQLVHQAHSFAKDPELTGCIASLAAVAADPLAAELGPAQEQVLLRLVRDAMPPLPPSTLADDLPWPPPPPAWAPRRESPAEAVLRDA